jgi:hypothetical protein
MTHSNGNGWIDRPGGVVVVVASLDGGGPPPPALTIGGDWLEDFEL